MQNPPRPPSPRPQSSLRSGAPNSTPGLVFPSTAAAAKAARTAEKTAARRERPTYGAALDEIAKNIDSLRVEYEKFFNGALQIPPMPAHDRLRLALRRLRDQPLMSYAERFRFTNLEARFNTYEELFNRRVRSREEGRGVHRPAEPAAPPPDLADGVVMGDGVDDAAVKALHARLQQDKSGPRLDLEGFRNYLDRQTTSIRGKTGCSLVRFRLVEEEGQTKLKAKPIYSA